jgi:transcription factor CRZ1
MADSHSNGSPYINDIDLQPPSPTSSQPLNLYSNDYHNSPYSSHSDLSFGADTNHPAGLVLFSDDGYDPSEFDNPNSGSSLLMFDGQASDDYYNFYRSPSPSGSDNNNEAIPSGASSASSNHPHFSPNLSMAHSFENLSFQSPNWGNEALPSQNKAPSPPRLMIADQQVPIVVNAPEDNNNDMGPSLNVVPATPIGVGVGVGNMNNQHQPASSNWLEPEAHSGFPSRSVSPAHSQGATTPGPSRSPSSSPQPAPALLLDQQAPRSSRRRSDADRELPNWNITNAGDGFSQNLSSQQSFQGGTGHPPTLGAGFTFGGPSSNGAINTAPTNNGFLSPEYPEFNLSNIRRTKSDTGGTGLNRHRGSRSEDFRFSDQHLLTGGQTGAGLPFPQNDFLRNQQQSQLQQQQQQYLNPGMQPPDMIRPSHSHSQSLSAQYPGHVNNITGSPNLSAASATRHYRRASSGTRSERGVGQWEDNLGHSNRASPYPSPHASPRGRPMPLGQDEYGYMGNNGMGGLTVESAAGLGPKIPSSGTAFVGVSKPNVTTIRTTNASQKRRKQEATFVCPVPGCNSTFTRSFNLKGLCNLFLSNYASH